MKINRTSSLIHKWLLVLFWCNLKNNPLVFLSKNHLPLASRNLKKAEYKPDQSLVAVVYFLEVGLEYCCLLLMQQCLYFQKFFRKLEGLDLSLRIGFDCFQNMLLLKYFPIYLIPPFRISLYFLEGQKILWV